ncbi:ABC transporter ATP-binding protein [bacterium]|nr:ABC transporter ATP-binding protein [bacterium]
MMPAVKIVELTKVFKSSIRQKRTMALNGLNLEVKEGEILGYLGPNGAGKTTTFKILLGLLRPTKGEAWLLGKNIKDISSREEVGFLPEQPYFYDYLTAREFLDLYGQLYNLSKQARRARVNELLELVGLQNAASTQLRKFSRGMLQRIGVAQALINEPKLLFLDEPMAALDPIGRKQMRDIILRLKSEGKTVLYSSHILSDVEAISDRVAILSQGKLLGVGQLDNLLGTGERLVEMNIEGLDEEGKTKIKRLALESIVEKGNRIIVNISEEIVQEVQEIVVQHEAKLISLMPRMESLEDIFIRKMEEE